MLWGNAVLQQYWQPGQIVEINLPDRGVEGEYLIQRVTITPTWSNPSIWTYRVEYGGRLFGIADFLKALVSAQQKKRNIEPSKSIQKYIYGEETLSLADELITTPRTLPFVCGDPDAVCGMVVVGDKPITKIEQLLWDATYYIMGESITGQSFKPTDGMVGATRLYIAVLGTQPYFIPLDYIHLAIYDDNGNKPGAICSSFVEIPGNEWPFEPEWVGGEVVLNTPLEAGKRYWLTVTGIGDDMARVKVCVSLENPYSEGCYILSSGSLQPETDLAFKIEVVSDDG